MRLPKRGLETHKGDYGKLLIVAGCRGMSGAAILAGRAALRSGAGLVTLAVPETIETIVASAEPCYMTISADQILGPQLEKYSTVAMGPGLGQAESTENLVLEICRSVRAQHLLLDADALNILARYPWPLNKPRQGTTVITPHEGEFTRLLGRPLQDRVADAQLFARQHSAIVVLKGHQTVITDGDQVVLNPTGNPGMATGGSGDVLTGILGALLGYLSPFTAAVIACNRHGRAGDLARERLGETALIASDIIQFLPQAFLEIES